ncbi:IclR family transcriptional regulator [Pseudomonas sp. BN414]|uniref:IclR family transcriptional regulator n=1 Tax=Pseudomonas sp. BN414 TaxID=2567888 RepID=UPI002454420F|nr:IclR family transcriptional regulator [Pseudomonas sp. BN414]MDH4566916.1 IclR family transcriptional regulator [Pseudomonas sp. BN414]
MEKRGRIDTELDSQDLEQDRQFVTALARGLELLRCFRPGERLLGNQELVKRSGLPKATVSRLTYTLTRLGYLQYVESLGKYALDTGVLALGYAHLNGLDIRKQARPLMQEFADQTQCSVSLGARDRLSMVYIENCQGPGPLSLRLDVGSRIPMTSTAMGRAYLAALPDAERDLLLDQLKARDDDWATTREQLDKAFRHYQDHGYCLSCGDWQKDINAVGVPLIQSDGSGVVAFSCGGPAFVLRQHMLEDDVGPRLAHLVRNVGANLGRQFQ